MDSIVLESSGDGVRMGINTLKGHTSITAEPASHTTHLYRRGLVAGLVPSGARLIFQRRSCHSGKPYVFHDRRRTGAFSHLEDGKVVLDQATNT
ncbi:hypothetical protein FKM82_005715 [Ascaphus truei]